jgi:hypothetical protein
MHGQLVVQGGAEVQSLSKSLPPGIYEVRIVLDQKTMTKKWIKL